MPEESFDNQAKITEDVQMPELLMSPEKRGEQLDGFQALIGEDLLAPNLSQTERIQITTSELKQRYPQRYRIMEKVFPFIGKNDDEIDRLIPREEREQIKDWLRIVNRLDTYIFYQQIAQEEEEGALWPRQLEAMLAIQKHMEQGKKDGYIKLPTGCGKTKIFTELLEATIGCEYKGMVVVPTLQLIDQTVDSFTEDAPGVEIGTYSGESKTKDLDKQITAITYNSFANGVNTGSISPSDFHFLVLDEAHRTLSDMRKDVVEKFKGAFRLGFTATPKFSDKKQVDDLLGECIYSLSIGEAIDEKMLCPVDTRAVMLDADIRSVGTNNEGDYIESQLAIKMDNENLNKSIARLYKDKCDGHTGVVYCVGVKHAENIADAFNKAGVNAKSINGKMSKKERRGIIDEYKRGDIDVLCNADLLIEGFDERKAEVCFNLRPTMSAVIAEQRGGRVLRKDRNLPNKHAFIVDFIPRSYDEKKAPILYEEILGGSQRYPKDYHVQNQMMQDLQELGIEDDESEKGLKVFFNEQIAAQFFDQYHKKKEQALQETNTHKGTWYAEDDVCSRFGLRSDVIYKLLCNYCSNNASYSKYLGTAENITNSEPDAIAYGEQLIKAAFSEYLIVIFSSLPEGREKVFREIIKTDLVTDTEHWQAIGAFINKRNAFIKAYGNTSIPRKDLTVLYQGDPVYQYIRQKVRVKNIEARSKHPSPYADLLRAA